MHKTFLRLIIGLVVTGTALTILEIWVDVVSAVTYTKSMTTIGILIVVLGLVLVLKRDLSEHKTLKDENYLD